MVDAYIRVDSSLPTRLDRFQINGSFEIESFASRYVELRSLLHLLARKLARRAHFAFGFYCRVATVAKSIVDCS